MNYSREIRSAVGIAVIILLASIPLFAGSMGVSYGHDLDRLWARAEKNFDLASHDAVLLLESRHVSILDNGDLRTRVHRIVWIGTSVGIGGYADLRIPWNSAASTLSVDVLRTWMDDKWWPDMSGVSPVAVVETLPFALALADDYTNMRETMLLHEGVEIPCIMETLYEITEKAGAEGGADGLWIFAQDDPAVLVEFTLSLPAGEVPAFSSGNGAPEPEISGSNGRMREYTWKMDNPGRLGSPRISNPSACAPYVVWSTWKDWNALGDRIISSFDKAAVLSDAIADTLAARVRHEPSQASKAVRIAGLINEYTRCIHYDSRFWIFSPRPAVRTYKTAYGHGLDRAVFAAALFRESGLNAEPVYRSSGLSGIDPGIPGLSRFEGIGVFVSGVGVQAIYDPVDGTLTNGSRPFYGRVVWKPASGTSPGMYPAPYGPEGICRFELILTLEPDGKGGWFGRGFVDADGIFCPYDEMAGLRGEAIAIIKSIAGSVLQGASVDNYNLEFFHRRRVTAGFDLALEGIEADDRGRTRIMAGDPTGGIMASLPSDLRMYHEHRGTPVILPGKMAQRVRLRLKAGEREIIFLPEARGIENEAGAFALRVEREDGWIVIDRELTLGIPVVQPGMWPALRALLLEELDSENRTILMK